LKIRKAKRKGGEGVAVVVVIIPANIFF